jgi:hypothetical protein
MSVPHLLTTAAAAGLAAAAARAEAAGGLRADADAAGGRRDLGRQCTAGLRHVRPTTQEIPLLRRLKASMAGEEQVWP